MLPNFHVSRISSQQGRFLVNCNYGMTLEESLADMMQSRRLNLVVPDQVFSELSCSLPSTSDAFKHPPCNAIP
jgi:hypothetical protein